MTEATQRRPARLAFATELTHVTVFRLVTGISVRVFVRPDRRQYRENWSGLEKSCLSVPRRCYLASAPVHYSRTTDHIVPAMGVATLFVFEMLSTV